MNEEKRIATPGCGLVRNDSDGGRAVEGAGPHKDPARTPEVIGAEIRMYVDAGRRVTLLCGIEIGRRLCEAKDMLPHGEWLPWLSRETDFSDRKAQLYMQAFREYGAKQLWIFEPETNAKTFADLPISKALALLSVPESEREAFAAEVGAESLSTRELQEAIRERDEALKREKAAREELLQADEGHALAITELQEKLDAARREADQGKDAREQQKKAEEEKATLERQLGQARDTIRELESRPVEVAVERDEQAIQDAAREARAKAVAEAAERETALQKQLDAALKKAEKAEKAAQKAKEAAEKAGQDDKAELAKAAQEAAAARQEAEELRKKLKLADPTATEFKAYFEQLQQLWGGLTGVIGRAEPELGEKLKKAARTLLEKFGEALG